MTQATMPKDLRVLISADTIQKRVAELGRQISADYRGKALHAVCVLENGFMFMADLVRYLDVPVACQFIKPLARDVVNGPITTREIAFSPEIDVRGHHVLLIEGIVQSGVTSDFLIRNMMGRGAESVKLAVFLDKSSARSTDLKPDYYGFVIDSAYVLGYGLGGPDHGRNLPYVATNAKKAVAIHQ